MLLNENRPIGEAVLDVEIESDSELEDYLKGTPPFLKELSVDVHGHIKEIFYASLTLQV